MKEPYEIYLGNIFISRKDEKYIFHPMSWRKQWKTHELLILFTAKVSYCIGLVTHHIFKGKQPLFVYYTLFIYAVIQQRIRIKGKGSLIIEDPICKWSIQSDPSNRNGIVNSMMQSPWFMYSVPAPAVKHSWIIIFYIILSGKIPPILQEIFINKRERE